MAMRLRDDAGVNVQKASPIKMITAKECALDIVNAVKNRKSLVISPSWYAPILFMRKLFPGLVDKILINVFAPQKKSK
jgi:hypothetical protein